MLNKSSAGDCCIKPSVCLNLQQYQQSICPPKPTHPACPAAYCPLTTKQQDSNIECSRHQRRKRRSSCLYQDAACHLTDGFWLMAHSVSLASFSTLLCDTLFCTCILLDFASLKAAVTYSSLLPTNDIIFFLFTLSLPFC